MSEQSTNLHIWEQVQETPTTATKTNKFQGRDVTSINAQYIVQRATEVWGPIGFGWGYEIVEERCDDMGPMFHNDQMVGTYKNHTILLRLWYKQDGEKYHVDHFGHTPYVYRSKNGPMVDQDAPKKSLTDALKKCLSMLGFAADIFLGMYDDQDYVEAVKTKEYIQKADDADAAAVEEIEALRDQVVNAGQGYQLIPNKAALKLAHDKNVKSIQRKAEVLGANSQSYVNALTKKYEERLQELSPANKICTDCGTVSPGQGGEACPECNSNNTAPQQ